MTAPDPRVGEIHARLAAATPGPWEEYWQGHIHAPANYPQAAATSICQTFGREDRRHPNAEFIAAAPADVAYLLAELADRDEKLAAVAVLAEAWRYKGEFGWGAWQEGHGPDQEGYTLDQASTALRAAVAAAGGGGE